MDILPISPNLTRKQARSPSVSLDGGLGVVRVGASGKLRSVKKIRISKEDQGYIYATFQTANSQFQVRLRLEEWAELLSQIFTMEDPTHAGS